MTFTLNGGKEDKVREASKGSCVKMQTRGDGEGFKDLKILRTSEMAGPYSSAVCSLR